MAYRPRAYDDADATEAMLLDARRAALVLPLRPAVSAPGEVRFRADKVKREISVDEAAFRLACALE